MIIQSLQKAIYEFRENDLFNRYPSTIYLDSPSLIRLKDEIDPYMVFDKNLVEKSMSFYGIKVIEDNSIFGFKVE